MMSRAVFVLMTSCLLQYNVIHLTQGSEILFQSSPNTIIEGLTSSLTLNCSLSDTAASGSVVGRRDVSHTSDNMASVSSLIIMKDGSDVASVTPSLAAHVMDGSSNIQTAGRVNGNSGQTAYLQLTVTDPSVDQTGEFTCEVNALSASGHVVTFSTSIEVSRSTPTLADLVTYVRDLNKKNDDLEKSNQLLKTQVEDLEKTVDQLKNTNGKIVSFNAGLTKLTNIQQHEVLVFDRIVDNTGHDYNAATGFFVCEIPGDYDFSVSCLAEPNKVLDLDVFRNGTPFFTIYGASGSKYSTAAGSAPVLLAKGDVVKVVARQTTLLHQDHCYFSGFLVTAS